MSTSSVASLQKQLAQSSGAPPLRDAVAAAYCMPEPQAVEGLLARAGPLKQQAGRIHILAGRLAAAWREQKASGQNDLTQSLLQEFSLSDKEGVALMCLAEALLRIPDKQTRNALIRDKISAGDWQRHLGASASTFVNAAAWGLLVTGRLVSHHESGLAGSLARLAARGGEPLIRAAVDVALRKIGEQFVAGQTIAEALSRSQEPEQAGFRHSYDMLGEAALTSADAQRYMRAYEQAVHAIGKAGNRRGIYDGPGISVKLSALHPRYSRAKIDRVMAELYARLQHLAVLAKHYDMGLNIDAEEADRLEISLRLVERLRLDPLLAGWDGMGVAVQAYQKRCPQVVDFLLDLARRSGHRLMIRLVKGAYWDTEIKRAQVGGLPDYPVFTRKAHTDLAYLVCAQTLLSAPKLCYPQFGTHNVHTVAAIHEMAQAAAEPREYEFQCLHGMGEALYRQVAGPTSEGKLGHACRIYAPVGTHDTLLAYLARRLLENGANTSFVNQISVPSRSIDSLIQDPVHTVERAGEVDGKIGLPHPRIPLPAALFGPSRVNSTGADLNSEHIIATLTAYLLDEEKSQWHAAPIINGQDVPGQRRAVLNPARRSEVVGYASEATATQVNQAVAMAAQGWFQWSRAAPDSRAAILEAAATALERSVHLFMAMLIREAARTSANALAEVREAVDFLRFYARQARGFARGTHEPWGPVACISPWNFPLSIFTGQVAAALAAGNTVLAKPAGQTPLVAHAMVRLLLNAGIPATALQLLPGAGAAVGSALVADERIKGVLFTGSTDVAKTLARQIAGRLDARGRQVPLIAETGGQNAMLVDSSALPEQVVGDVMASAFDSAGQRCSALRVLCLQDDIAEPVLRMLKGAMAQQAIGEPILLATDIGPVIDGHAKARIMRHIEQLKAQGCAVFQAHDQNELDRLDGAFIAPTLIEIPSVLRLEDEVFGPVLHLVRYKRQDSDSLIQHINSLGYGLTFGLHSRIDETIAKASSQARAGNIYVNRNIVGAVVGVQPFGGEGLSGTGPKAGGPLYLLRLLSQKPASAAMRALESPDVTISVDTSSRNAMQGELAQLQDWALQHQRPALAKACQLFAANTPSGTRYTLPGPTGELNTYSLHPKGPILCLGQSDDDLLMQLAATVAVGSHALVLSEHAAPLSRLPHRVLDRVHVVEDWQGQRFEAALFHGSRPAATELAHALAGQEGPIIALIALDAGCAQIPLERLVVERSISINTAAAGGNPALLTMDRHPFQTA